MGIHGISIREKSSNNLIEFIKCDVGRIALKVLTGVRINLGNDFIANEENISEEEYNGVI